MDIEAGAVQTLVAFEDDLIVVADGRDVKGSRAPSLEVPFSMAPTQEGTKLGCHT